MSFREQTVCYGVEHVFRIVVAATDTYARGKNLLVPHFSVTLAEFLCNLPAAVS
jgi:hypothetical protein